MFMRTEKSQVVIFILVLLSAETNGKAHCTVRRNEDSYGFIQVKSMWFQYKGVQSRGQREQL